MTAILDHVLALPDAPAVLLVSHDETVLDRADVIYRLHDGHVTALPDAFPSARSQ